MSYVHTDALGSPIAKTNSAGAVIDTSEYEPYGLLLNRINDDRVGYTAILLQGQYPQKHMKGQQGSELCLYNKQSKTAYVTEWDSIRPAAKKP